ncbi:MAG TPA: helix-turn-helix transcriptional regulator, partial [Pseudonocardiaceae bacterium]|nr:helix-turn-helix transcriptional regulator [Pseudonocardiaceae bacterium]
MTSGGDIERARRALNHPDPREIHDRADFARKLTEAKDRAGLTVRDIASGTGIAPATVGDYCAGRHVPSARQADTLVAILAYCGITQPEEQAEWLAALSRVRRTRARQRDAVEPYRGLSPFTARDAEWFFGRDELVRELADQVTARSAGALPVLVIGSSGSGKSSLLHAGLVPAVARRGDHWLSMTPGAHPVRSLTECLAARPEGRLLLVVDQFEEVFTACDDEAERVEFLDLLLERRPDTQVVLGMRADCYERAARYPGLIPVLRDQPIVVGPMTEAQLRECIVRPAAKARVELESGLVELLLRDLAPTVADVGSLPLLSHALLAMWQRQERGRMTVEAYRAGGGIQEAVARSAESVYAGLSPAQAALARHIFVRLVRLEPNTADSRVKVAPAELLPLDVTAADFTSVLDLLVEHRLVTSDVDGLQIVHEALIHAWPRLRGWLDADRADARTRRQLADAARTWDDSGRDPSGLWGGLLLDTVLAWPAGHGLNQLESEFLSRSAERRDEQVLAERNGVRRLRQLVAGLVALVAVSGGLAGYTVAQNAAATNQRDLAESRLVAGEAERLRT